MAASLEGRVGQLEQELSLLRRELAASNQRSAAPSLSIRGWWLAVLTSSLAYNGTGTAEILVWSGSAWNRSGVTKTVQGFWLNSDDAAVAACTLVKIEWYDNVWVPTAIYCKINNWLSGCP